MQKSACVYAVTVLFFASASALFATSYERVSLVADNATVKAQYGAQFVDSSLVNPWGMSFAATSPFWISNQGTGTSTLYSGAGVKTALTVTIPTAGSGPQGPTGQVFNSAPAGNFVISGGTSASFIFDTLAGTINAWNGAQVTTGTQVAATPGAVYTGLALANNGTANYLYAANFSSTGGGIRVFDSTFTDVTSTTFAGKFVDSAATAAGYEPYNVQLIGSSLYVEYAKPRIGGATVGAGLGIVDVYDLNGNLTKTLIGAGGALDAPWGVTLAPSNFGDFSNDLLVGNFGDGFINAYNPATGAWLGVLADDGVPIVDPGLWALGNRSNGGANSVPNGIYFSAGVNGEADGLFGYIAPIPEPSAYGLAALGLAALGAGFLRKRRSACQ
jgi:uncharacterized protein (TIGR03118 family)